MRLIPNPRLVFDIVGPWIGFGKRLESVAKEHPYAGDRYRRASVRVRNYLLPFLKGVPDEKMVEEVGELDSESGGEGSGGSSGSD